MEHSVADTLYLIPFLFVTYLAMEWLEHKTGGKTQEAIRHAGAAGPIVGAFLGVVPQCGFSAVAATLYAGRVITLGTLFAVFLSTSDEMLPIFLAEAVPGNTILSIMGAKVVIGMVMGFIVDAVLRLAVADLSRGRVTTNSQGKPLGKTLQANAFIDDGAAVCAAGCGGARDAARNTARGAVRDGHRLDASAPAFPEGREGRACDGARPLFEAQGEKRGSKL